MGIREGGRLCGMREEKEGIERESGKE